MNTILKKIKEAGNNLISWIVYWTPIILAIAIFILAAMMIGNLIGKHVWIVFAADLVFLYLLWIMLDISRSRQMTIPKQIVILTSLLLFLFIAFATLGVAMVTEQKVLINAFIFPISCIAVFALYVSKNKSVSRWYLSSILVIQDFFIEKITFYLHFI